MEFRLLGPLQVIADERDVTPRAAKVRTLLAVLVVHRGHSVDVDHLTAALWGADPPATSANLVHGYVRDLRRVLGDRVRTGTAGYLLDLTHDAVDVDTFGALSRVGRCREALALWRGPALCEWAEQEWARGASVRLDQERLAVLERRLDADVAGGHADEVVGELIELVTAMPLREHLHALLVRALYASGRQVEALQAHAAARRVLREEAGLDPGQELRDLERAVLAQDPALDPEPASLTVPLPANPILGRAAELAKVDEMLRHARLVALVGAGGIGKTRLAVEVAGQQRPGEGEVWLVELVAAADLQQVASAIATVLRLGHPAGDPVAHLASYLRQRRGLLVLDNCEHVVDVVASLVQTLLRRSPDLRVLVTSRQPLRIAGEHVLVLEGLAPTAAAQLFVVRARSANARAALGADAVRRVVATLEGVPLAVELASARTVSMTLDEIETGLERPLVLLSTDSLGSDRRHRTMRAVIGWSHDLLSESDQVALAALSVFVGPFPMEAARAVSGSSAPTAVERLLLRCLLARDPDAAGEARFRMSEVVRQYAQQAHPHEVVRARERHVRYHAGLAERMATGLRTRDAASCAAEVRRRARDLRAAVEHGFEAGAPVTASLVADLYWPWLLDGRLAEHSAWAARALAVGTDAPVGPRLHRALASAAMSRSDLDVAERAARLELDSARQMGDDEQMALAEGLLGMAAWARGDRLATKHHAASVCHARLSSDPWVLGLATAFAGRAAHAAGDHGGGADLLDEATRVAERVGEPMVLASALDYRAHAEFAAGHHDEAAALGARSLRAYEEIGYQEGIASAVTLAANLAVLAGRHEDAERLLVRALDICERLGHEGGIATVLESSALERHSTGDQEAAVRLLAESRDRRVRSGTSVPHELRGPLALLEAELRPTGQRPAVRPVGSEQTTRGS